MAGLCLPARRDLKAENVLLHTNDQWVLCDFGSSTSQQQVRRLARVWASRRSRPCDGGAGSAAVL